MTSFRIDGAIDQNESRAVASFLELAKAMKTELPLADLLTADEMRPFSEMKVLWHGDKPDNRFQFSGAQTKVMALKFNNIFLKFSEKPIAWFQAKGLEKSKTIDAFRGLVMDMERAVKNGNLTMSCLPPSFYYQPVSAGKVSKLLARFGIQVPEKSIGEKMHGKVVALHEGKSEKIIVIYSEAHDDKVIYQDQKASTLALGLKAIFHETVSFPGEMTTRVAKAQVCSRLDPNDMNYYRPAADIKCQLLDGVRVFGVATPQQHQAYSRAKVLSRSNLMQGALKVHQVTDQRSKDYVVAMMDSLQSMPERAAAFYLGYNHLDSFIASLEERGVSYLVVVPQGLSAQFETKSGFIHNIKVKAQLKKDMN